MIRMMRTSSARGEARGESRQDAFERLQRLNLLLLRHDSATLALDNWCGGADRCESDQVVVERLALDGASPSPHALDDDGAGTLRHRRVRLRYGGHTLSQADNWYRADCLSPEMNATLDATNVSFGRVVKALNFRRRTISVEFLWDPSRPHHEVGVVDDAALPDFVLRHQAILTLPDGTPFSEVIELYSKTVLFFEQK